MKIFLFFAFMMVVIVVNAQDTCFFEGSIEHNFQKLPLTIEYTHSQKDSLLLFFGSPSQTDSLLRANKAYLKGDSLLFQLKSANIIFRGRFHGEDTIIGLFKQGLLKTDLTFVRRQAKFHYNRPQTPNPPYPYLVEEVEFINPKIPNYKFKGTLTMPKRGSNFPCVILISGSGIQNRDEEIYGHKPFLILADHLTKCGVAVFRFDDRGYHSSDPKLLSATTLDYVTDVEAAISAMKKHTKINKSRIGLLGHSEGGLIAQIIASKDSTIKYTVLLAAPGLNGREVLRSQLEAIAKASDISQDSLSQLLAIQAKTLDKSTDKWTKTFLTLNPADYLQNMRQPTLILQGLKDLQIVADANLEAIKQNFGKKKGNNSLQVITFSECNHLFQRCNTGLPSEYIDIDMTLDPDILHHISQFIRYHSGLRK
ncbi:MAG: alpha/beta hydrolase [Bacteroidales bacterium]|jgi:pimeloyl-ACP methyl ester carboxylesterase|nr:alpha/beta hydrolase [Bacteroidales bacterium]